MEQTSKIIMPYGEQKHLRELMGVSQVTVRRALAGSQTKTGMRIRHMAKQLGGVEVRNGMLNTKK